MAIDIIETWANTGDISIIPDEVQPDGSVSFKQGWGNDYQLDPATVANAKKLSRSNFNYLFSLLTTNQQEQLLYGFNNHIVGKTYPAMARVRGADGLIYESIVETNTTPPNTDWIEFGATDEYALLNGDENETFKVADATESNQAVNLGQFTGLFSENGYVKLPNGLIMQWGKTTAIPTDGRVTVIYPIEFPVIVFNASATLITPATIIDHGMSVSVANVTKTSLQCENQSLITPFVPLPAFWFAIGY